MVLSRMAKSVIQAKALIPLAVIPGHVNFVMAQFVILLAALAVLASAPSRRPRRYVDSQEILRVMLQKSAQATHPHAQVTSLLRTVETVGQGWRAPVVYVLQLPSNASRLALL
jgi:flagellar biosynthesis component FlhA